MSLQYIKTHMFFVSILLLLIASAVTYKAYDFVSPDLGILISTITFSIAIFFIADFFLIAGGITAALTSTVVDFLILTNLAESQNWNFNIIHIILGQTLLFLTIGIFKGRDNMLRLKINAALATAKKSRKNMVENQNRMHHYQKKIQKNKTDAETNYFAKIIKTAQLAKDFGSTYDIKDIIEITKKASKSLIGAKSLALFLVKKDGKSFKYTSNDSWEGSDISTISVRSGNGILGWVINNKQFISSRSTAIDLLLKELIENAPFKFDLISPLIHKEKVTGLLIVQKIEPAPQNDDDWQSIFGLALTITSLSAMSLENAKNYKRIQAEATIDGLTNIYNHRCFQDLLGKALKVSRQKNENLAVVLLDIDFFKKFNDTYGHQIGDLVLIEVARLFKESMRPTDFVARYGGEEFIIVMANTKVDDAFTLADRVREVIADARIEKDGQVFNVNISMGISSFPKDSEKKSELIKYADQALYKAKENGRNRVEIWEGKGEA